MDNSTKKRRKPIYLFGDPCKIFDAHEMHQEISYRKYKSILKQLIKTQDITYGPNVELAPGINVVHITNETLSCMLYSNMDKLAEFSDSLKFISLRNEEKVVFVVCGAMEMDFDLLHKRIETFTTCLSNNESTIYIDYTLLFNMWIEQRYATFLLELFYSIVFDEHKLNKEELGNIIRQIVTEVFGPYEYESLKDGYKYNEEQLKNGCVARKTMPFPHFPPFINLNIARYEASLINNKEYFEDYEEFFVDFLEDSTAVYINMDCWFVFDEQLYLSQYSKTKEDESYILYSNSHEHCMMIKNKQETMACYYTVTGIYSLIFHYAQFLYCTESGNIYITWEDESKKSITRVAKFEQHKYFNIINGVLDIFENYDSVKDVIFFKNSSNIIDCINYDENSGQIFFSNFYEMHFSLKDNCQNFSCSEIILRYIKDGIDKNILDWQNYRNAFMKMFSPNFVEIVEEYINTGKYNQNKLNKSLKTRISFNDAQKLTFVDEVLPNTVESAAFINEEKLDTNVLAKIKQIQEKSPKVKGKFGKYDSLDMLFHQKMGNTPIFATEKNIKKYTVPMGDRFLNISSLIISEDKFVNNKYLVIGAVYDDYKLYNLYDLLQKNVLNLQEIYVVIMGLLKIYSIDGYALKGGQILQLKDVFIDDDLNVTFRELSSVSKVTRKDINRYYRQLTSLFMRCKIPDWQTFSSEDLGADKVGFPIINPVKLMELCPEHNVWRIKGKLCSECKKIYEVYDTRYLISLYDNFYGVNDEGEVDDTSYIINSVPEKLHKNVKLGILNNLYSEFSALAPLKLAIPDTGHTSPIGVLYEFFDFDGIVPLDSFKQIQRLKVVLVLYKELLPKILNGSFICTNQIIFNTMFMHKEYRGEIIIPNIAYLECDVIMSLDNELKETKKQETLKLFFNYIHNYLTQDEYFNSSNDDILPILKSIKNCTSNQDEIKSYLEKYSKFCKIHRVYYESNKSICPLCIAEGIKQERAIIKASEYYETLMDKSATYEGGEAFIYPCKGGNIQKIFNAKVDLSFKSKIIGKAMEKQQLFESFNDKHEDIKIVTIKDVLYSFENNVLTLKGYTEEHIDGAYKISCLKDKDFVAKNKIERIDVIDILIKVSIGIQFLHSIGVFIGDLNGGNILIKNKTVYFIDCDGMSMDDVKNSVYTNMYIYPPSAENKNITKDDDWYSLAVQAFYYLTYSHPFRGISGKKTTPLSELGRMKQGKSLLGSHGICPPQICIGWDFLPKELIKYFLDTFEKGKRESMLELLLAYKTSLAKEAKLVFSEVERKHPALISLSESLYVDTAENLRYDENVIAITNNVTAWRCFESYVVLRAPTATHVVNSDGTLYTYNKSYDHILDVYNGEIFYIIQNEVYVDRLDSTTNQIKTLRVDKVTNNKILDLQVLKPNFILFVEYNVKNQAIELYDNNSMQYTASFESSGIYSKIIHDSFSEGTLVLIGNAKNSKQFIHIDRFGVITKIDIKKDIGKKFIMHGSWIYFPLNSKIGCYNIFNHKYKEIECEDVNCTSAIQRYGNTFFISNEDGKAYVYTKS